MLHFVANPICVTRHEAIGMISSNNVTRAYNVVMMRKDCGLISPKNRRFEYANALSSKRLVQYGAALHCYMSTCILFQMRVMADVLSIVTVCWGGWLCDL